MLFRSGGVQSQCSELYIYILVTGTDDHCMTKVELPDVLREIRPNHHLFGKVPLAWAHDDFGPIFGISGFEIVPKINILDTTGLFWIELERHACYDVERRKWNKGK